MDLRVYVKDKLVVSDNLSLESVNESWMLFRGIIEVGVAQFVPLKNVVRVPHPLWYTTDIHKMLRRQRAARNVLRKAGSVLEQDKSRAIFNRLRTSLKRMLSDAHHHFMSVTLGQSLKSNPKYFWSYVKSQRKTVGSISVLDSVLG